MQRELWRQRVSGRSRSRRSQTSPSLKGITSVAVAGYKSIAREQRIEIRPLTVLAGANSSGKSSIMQPLLLLKQTLEASYDPGPLLLNGPNVRFTYASQLFSKGYSTNAFTVGLTVDDHTRLSETFGYQSRTGIVIKEMTSAMMDNVITLRPNMTHEEIESIVPQFFSDLKDLFHRSDDTLLWGVDRRRCFLSLRLRTAEQTDVDSTPLFFTLPTDTEGIERQVRRIIHVPGLRGNPERTYDRTTAVGPQFPGTFENYVASVISHWQATGDHRLTELSDALAQLGLTWGIEAKQVDDTTVELRVGRLPRPRGSRARDMVSIADVGFGVSQTLPLLVALLAAEPGQLVYIEQPEIHLHPRAQTVLAQVLAGAARRGVRVVVETHSSLLLLGIQTLVAEGTLAPSLVKLHWFRRRLDRGDTEVISADLDAAGTFDSEWPEDFADVALQAEGRFLDAVEERRSTTTPD